MGSEPGPSSVHLQALHSYLRAWSQGCPRPVVLFIDEIDSLAEDLLISVLRQLRMGYADRPTPFVHSLALVGLRDVRDYRVRVREDRDTLGSASPFNIKSDSYLAQLYRQVGELYRANTQRRQTFAR
jgi:hypothetical protein